MMKVLLISSILVLFTACNSGGNGNGAPGLTHNQLAEKFVQELNLDSEFSVTLTKKSTLEKNFIVIYDPYTDSYDAINIDNYNPASSNAADYYYANSARSFMDLDLLPGHYETELDYVIVGYDYDGYAIYGYEPVNVWVPTRYRDRFSGIVFEKVAGSSKDLAKVVALQEAAVLQKTAEFLSSEFGLSLSRGKEVASLQAHWKKSSQKAMTNTELDAFSTELLGFSISKGVKAYQSSNEGSSTAIETLVNQAANANGITPEHASKLMTKVFGL